MSTKTIFHSKNIIIDFVNNLKYMSLAKSQKILEDLMKK